MSASAAPDLVAVPPPPRTPSPRARDLIFKFQGAQFVLLLVGGIFLLTGGVLVTVFDARLPAEIAISLGGHAATGHVTATELEKNVRVHNRHPTLITFTYEASGAQHTGQSSTVDGAIVAVTQPGSDVPIEVAGANPAWARVRGTNISVLGLWGLTMLFFPSLGAILMLAAVRSRRRAIRAFVHGQPVTARVTFAGPDTTTRINGRHPLLVKWEFSREGRLFKGKVSSMHPALVEPLMKQAELVVLYDPDDPRINTCYVD